MKTPFKINAKLETGKNLSLPLGHRKAPLAETY